MTECIPDFHVSTISPVCIDRFSPNFCHWCILGHRWPDYVFGSKSQSSRPHHRGGGAQHSTLPSSATFSSFYLNHIFWLCKIRIFAPSFYQIFELSAQSHKQRGRHASAISSYTLAEQKVNKQRLIEFPLPWLYIYDASEHDINWKMWK